MSLAERIHARRQAAEDAAAADYDAAMALYWRAAVAAADGVDDAEGLDPAEVEAAIELLDRDLSTFQRHTQVLCDLRDWRAQWGPEKAAEVKATFDKKFPPLYQKLQKAREKVKQLERETGLLNAEFQHYQNRRDEQRRKRVERNMEAELVSHGYKGDEANGNVLREIAEEKPSPKDPRFSIRSVREAEERREQDAKRERELEERAERRQAEEEEAEEARQRAALSDRRELAIRQRELDYEEQAEPPSAHADYTRALHQEPRR